MLRDLMKEAKEENQELRRMLSMLLHTTGPEAAETTVRESQTAGQELGQQETGGRGLEPELGGRRLRGEPRTRSLGGEPGAHLHGERRLDLNPQARIRRVLGLTIGARGSMRGED